MRNIQLVISLLFFIGILHAQHLEEDLNINTQGNQGALFVDFMGKTCEIKSANIIKIEKPKQLVQSDDTVTSIMRTLVGIEDETQLLDVVFTNFDGPVSKLYIFQIESEEEKELSIALYDEEGVEMSVASTIKIEKGESLIALDVLDLEEGDYLFKITDKEERELSRHLKIERK